jgi:hypothetical protein
MRETGTSSELSGMHPSGALTVSPEAAAHLGVTEIHSVSTDKPRNMPFVDVHLVSAGQVPEVVPRAGFRTRPRAVPGSDRVDTDHLVEVGRGFYKNRDAKVVVDVTSDTPSRVKDSLGAALSERLHEIRTNRIAKIGSAAVMAALVLAGSALLPVLGGGFAAYGVLKLAGKIARPRQTFSTNPSYEYAEKVLAGVASTVNSQRR